MHEVALGLSVVIEFVLILVMGPSLGAGFVVGLLLSILLTSVMAGLVHDMAPATPSEGGLTCPDAPTVWSVAPVVNGTNVSGTLPPDRSNTNYRPAWQALAELFGWAWTLFGFTLAWGALMGAFPDPTGFVAPAVGFTLAVIGLLLAFVVVKHHSQPLTFLSIAVSGLSVDVDLYGLRKPLSGPSAGALRALNTMTFVGDGASFATLIALNQELL